MKRWCPGFRTPSLCFPNSVACQGAEFSGVTGGGRSALNGGAPLALNGVRLGFLVLRTPSVFKAQNFLGLLGAGVPPLLGALTSFAYWGALLLFSFPLSVFRFPFSVACNSL